MKKKSAYSALNRRLGTILFVAILVLAAFLRVHKLSSLPPGISVDEAQWVLNALNASRGSLGLLFEGSSNIGFAAYIGLGAVLLWLWESVLALRYLNAALGVVMVAGLYFWAKDSFGRRAALLAAFLAAVSPWALTLSRNVLPINLALAALVWLCFLAQRAYKTGKWGYSVAAALTMVAGCFSARLFWLVPVVFAVAAVVLLLQRKFVSSRKRLLVSTAVVGLLVLVPMAVLLLIGKANPAAGIVRSNVGDNTGFTVVAKASLENAGKTVLMFFTSGDENYTHNLGGVPLLNAFTALMFLLGVLLALARRSRMAYGFVGIGLTVLVLPSIVGLGVDAPDAYRAALAMPFIFMLAGIGTNHLLTRWYAMFPINTTARSLGLSFVVLLLVLTAYQGYRQYFVAWAQDPQTFVAYREDLVEAARYGKANQAEPYIVARPEELAVVAASRMARNATGFGGNIEQLESLPLANKPQVIILLGADSSELRALKRRVEAKFPKGSFGVNTSPFNESQLFVWYRTP